MIILLEEIISLQRQARSDNPWTPVLRRALYEARRKDADPQLLEFVVKLGELAKRSPDERVMVEATPGCVRCRSLHRMSFTVRAIPPHAVEHSRILAVLGTTGTKSRVIPKAVVSPRLVDRLPTERGRNGRSS